MTDHPHARRQLRAVAARLPGLVALAAFLALPGAARAAAPRSQDDRGFSITLISPADPYLTGRQTLRIEPIIPRGDTIEQVDFFVDGRLMFVVHGEPYSCEVDFGADIRRRTIDVRALTRQGRRAKVSLVSRSVDVTDGAASSVVTLAAVVRNAAGRPETFLGVSDFMLSENGVRQAIVHFAPGPSPTSMALVVDDRAGAARPGEALAIFLRDLPAHQAVALVDRSSPPRSPAPSSAGPPPQAEHLSRTEPQAQGGQQAQAGEQADTESSPFAADPAALAVRLQSSGLGEVSGSTAERVAAAAVALAAQHGPRVMLLVTGLEPPPPPPSPPPADAGDTTAAETSTVQTPAAAKVPGTAKAPAGKTPEPAAPPVVDPMAAALAEAIQARASIYVVALGTEDSPVPPALREAAEKSGGQLLLAHDTAALGQALQTVSEALRHRYLLTYMPVRPEQPGWRTIELTVSAPDLVVQAPKTLYLP